MPVGRVMSQVEAGLSERFVDTVRGLFLEAVGALRLAHTLFIQMPATEILIDIVNLSLVPEFGLSM